MLIFLIHLKTYFQNQARYNGKATIVVATAVTTKASSVIPFFPVYCMGLYRVMEDKGTHETPIMHQDRIYRDMLYGNHPEYDEKGRLRPDSWELDPEVQKETEDLINKINEDNFNSDLTGYSIFIKEYANLSGFQVDGYEEEDVEHISEDIRREEIDIESSGNVRRTDTNLDDETLDINRSDSDLDDPDKRDRI